jgi:hypothetical protein
MRWIFVALLLANILYFGWEIDQQTRNNAAIARVRQIAGDSSRLKLLSEAGPETVTLKPVVAPDIPDPEAQIDYASPDGPGPGASNTAANDLVADLPDFRLSSAAPDTGQKYCFTFGPVPEELLITGLEDWFKSRQFMTKTRFTDEQGRQLFWIYLAPDSSRTDAMETIEDLQQKGISDYRIITGGNLDNAISLGLFSSQASVNNRLRELKQKGYTPVVVPYTEDKRIYWLDVRFSQNPEELAGVFSGFPARYNYVPVDCNKIDMSATST